MVCSQRANPGDVLLTFVNQLNYFYQCTEGSVEPRVWLLMDQKTDDH